MTASPIESFTHKFAKWAGTTTGLVAAVLSVLTWLVAGHFVEYSPSWENGLTVYIGIVTFILIFLMQRAQNKELAAIHLKLNELIATEGEADNTLINAEKKTEDEIEDIQKSHEKIA